MQRFTRIPQVELKNFVDLEKKLKNACTLAFVAVHTAENEQPLFKEREEQGGALGKKI